MLHEKATRDLPSHLLSKWDAAFFPFPFLPRNVPPFRKARDRQNMSFNGKENNGCGFFFDKTIIPICICLITQCVNLRPFSLNLARPNAANRWAKDFLSRASIYFLKPLFSVGSVCLLYYSFFFFPLWGLILVPAGRSHQESAEWGERGAMKKCDCCRGQTKTRWRRKRDLNVLAWIREMKCRIRRVEKVSGSSLTLAESIKSEATVMAPAQINTINKTQQ